MAYEKLIRLAKSLYEKTQAGAVNWEATANESVFQTSLSNYSVLIAKRSSDDPDDPGDYIVLSICNNEGRTMEELFQGDAYSGGFYDMMDFFHLARRTAMGVEKALDEILDVLESPTEKK